MDENSCEDETSKGVEDGQKAKTTENTPEFENMGVRIAVGQKVNENIVSDRCGSSCDASGPSTEFTTLKSKNDDARKNPGSMTIDKPTESSVATAENEAVSVRSLQPLSSVVINTQPTKQFLLPIAENEQSERQAPSAPSSAALEENCNVACILPNYESRPDFSTRVRMAPGVKEHLTTRKTSIGPPPSYSFVMKQKKKVKMVVRWGEDDGNASTVTKSECLLDSELNFQPSTDPLAIDRPPPPSYTGARELFLTPEESRLERICNLPSFVAPVWRSHSQPALCPRCGVIVLTTTHSHDSVATHVAALALCLFGCWPCCLLPYCMNACKNTYHHCPICQAFLGLYTPW